MALLFALGLDPIIQVNRRAGCDIAFLILPLGVGFPARTYRYTVTEIVVLVGINLDLVVIVSAHLGGSTLERTVNRSNVYLCRVLVRPNTR